MKPLLFLLFFLVAACSSQQTRIEEFNSIQLGMVKSDVIAKAGAPYWSDRKKGQDRWIYYMNPKDREQEKVVYFEDGKVVAIGARKKSTLSADEMDAIKEKKIKTKPHKRKYSDKELKQIIKKELKKSKKKSETKFEKI